MEPKRCLSSRACKFLAQCSAAPGSPSKASSKQVGSWTAEDSAAKNREDGGIFYQQKECVISATMSEKWTDLTHKNWAIVISQLSSCIGDIMGYMTNNMIWV